MQGRGKQMPKTRANLLETSAGQLVGKQQLYALLVDAAGAAILNAGGNEQIVELQAVDGLLKVEASITGSLPDETLQEQLTETDVVAGVLTFTENIFCVEIYNTDTVNKGTFTVNEIDIVVPSLKVFKSAVGGTPSTEVTVSGATSYIVSRYE